MTTFSSVSKKVRFAAFYTNGEDIIQFSKRTGCEPRDLFGDGLQWFRSTNNFQTPESAEGYVKLRKHIVGSCWNTAAKTRVAKVTVVEATFVETLDQESGEEVK